jgi:hypothetical protein
MKKIILVFILLTGMSCKDDFKPCLKFTQICGKDTVSVIHCFYTRAEAREQIRIFNKPGCTLTFK